MRVYAFLALGAVSLGVLAACAPKAPPPIMPEPVYDKYGNAVISGGGECRDGRQSYARDSAYSQLPICEGTCGPGYVTTAALDQCIPVDRGDEQPRGGKTPTRG